MCVVAVVLSWTIIWFVAQKQQRLNDELAQNHAKIVAHDSVTKSVTRSVDSAKTKTAHADSAYDSTRAKLHVVHDTTFLPSDTPGKVDTVTNSTLARLIFSSDSMKVAHKEESAKQDLLIASLRVDISNRDDRIKLLESRGTPRFSSGFQAGVGYCYSGSGKICAYAGYGVQVRGL